MLIELFYDLTIRDLVHNQAKNLIPSDAPPRYRFPHDQLIGPLVAMLEEKANFKKEEASEAVDKFLLPHLVTSNEYNYS